MKTTSLILLLSLAMLSCNQKTIEYTNSVEKQIGNAELVISQSDKQIKEAISSNQANKITEYTQEATSKTNAIMAELLKIQAPENGIQLKASALDYIRSMQLFLHSQEAYKNISDSITMLQADSLDALVNMAFSEMNRKQQSFLIKQNEIKAK